MPIANRVQDRRGAAVVREVGARLPREEGIRAAGGGLVLREADVDFHHVAYTERKDPTAVNVASADDLA